MRRQSYDIVIVGGGVMGCAIATYLLRANRQLKVAIFEKDAAYTRASTPLSDGNTRVQFNLKENIQMSLYALQVLKRFSEEMATDEETPDVAFRQQGNLFIVNEPGLAAAQQGLALQIRLGGRVVWLEPDEVKSVYPPYNLAGCIGGTFGPLDGSMSPLAVLLAYKRKAISLGADFIEAEVKHIIASKRRVQGVELASGSQISTGIVVNCTGAWAASLAQTAGVDLPVKPVKRQVFVIETGLKFDTILPSIFFPSGLYCIHEGGGHFMCGKSLADDPVGVDDFSWSKERFETHLWPELVSYLPAFDRLKVRSGWAGLYAVNTLDGNAILGEWPSVKGLFLANGFSGHGFQQCHAVGLYLSELILGITPTLDLAAFSPQRILENRPVLENQGKII